MRRKLLTLLLFTLFLFLVCLTAQAEKATFGGVSFSTDSEAIDLGSVQVTDYKAFCAFLDAFEHLQKVDMFETKIYRDNIEMLAARYPDIEFGWTMCFAEHEIRTDVTAYSTLHMSNAKTHGNADIALIRFCRHLKALDIGHNAVSDLSFLYDLPELRVLIIACNKVEDITPVGSLKNLEYLEMFTNNIRDISPLNGLEHLMDLNICYNYISDISPLYTLKSLKRLWTCLAVNRGMGKSLTQTQINELKAAFPNLELNNTSSPTGGTWREHSHFETFHTFFRTGVYEPFEDSFPDEGEPLNAMQMRNAVVDDEDEDVNVALDEDAPIVLDIPVVTAEPEPTPRKITIKFGN